MSGDVNAAETIRIALIRLHAQDRFERQYVEDATAALDALVAEVERQTKRAENAETALLQQTQLNAEAVGAVAEVERLQAEVDTQTRRKSEWCDEASRRGALAEQLRAERDAAQESAENHAAANKALRVEKQQLEERCATNRAYMTSQEKRIARLQAALRLAADQLFNLGARLSAERARAALTAEEEQAKETRPQEPLQERGPSVTPRPRTRRGPDL